MQRSLAGTDFENLPAATDVQAIEERVGHRVPQARLRPKTRCFVLRVTEKIFVRFWQNVVRSFSPLSKVYITKFARASPTRKRTTRSTRSCRCCLVPACSGARRRRAPAERFWRSPAAGVSRQLPRAESAWQP